MEILVQTIDYFIRIDLEFKPEGLLGREYFRLGESELTSKRGRHRQERALVMKFLHRYSGLKQRRIAERFEGLDEGLVTRDRRAIREKIETEPKILKWFQDLTRRST
jgi:hypothetical protein